MLISSINFQVPEHYCFIPKENKLLMKIISKDINISEVLLPNSIPRLSLLSLNPGIILYMYMKLNGLLVVFKKFLMKQMIC